MLPHSDNCELNRELAQLAADDKAISARQSTAYADVKASAFCSGTMPDGFFGKQSPADFSLLNGDIVAVCSFGYFRTGLTASNETEAWKALMSNDRGIVVKSHRDNAND